MLITDMLVIYIDFELLVIYMCAYRRVLVVQKSKLLDMLGWSIVWEVIHSKVKGIQLIGNTLEAIYKSKRSGVRYICSYV